MAGLLTSSRRRGEPFDLAVGGVVLLLLLLVGLLLWRGDQVGLRVTSTLPPAGATAVPGGSGIRLTFAETVDRDSVPDVTITPAVRVSRRWEGDTLVLTPWVPLQPETSYTVTLPRGAVSRQGRVMNRTLRWSFTTRAPQIVFISWDDENRDQLTVADQDGANARRLTDEPYGLIDFAPSPDGTRIAYAALRADGGADLWQVPAGGGTPRLLLDCAAAIPGASCNTPLWQPGSNRLLYERRNFLQEGAPPGPPRLYWLDVTSGATAPVFEDTQWLSLGASFSPDGRWLSYISPQETGVRIFNLDSGENLFFATPTGQQAWWSPAGDRVVLTDMQLRENGFAMHLFAVELATGQYRDLSGNLDVEDGPPAWSPVDGTIAFGRKASRTAMGKQIWLISPDGSENWQLTQDANVHHGALSWHPDGRTLLFQRYEITTPGAVPQIWVLDVDSGDSRMIAPEGLLPAWLP